MTDGQMYVAIVMGLSGCWMAGDMAYRRVTRRPHPVRLYDWADDPFYSQPCHVRKKAS